VAAELWRWAPALPVIHCQLAPTGLLPLEGGPTRPLAELAGAEVLAVAALATPGPFLAHLAAVGAEADAALFADHHEFTAEEATALIARAGERRLVMTLKDAVKLRHLLGPEVDAWVLHQAVTLERGEDLIEAALGRALEARSG
jgi:tetraacyldisaccharide 4'-kinase